MSIGVASFDFTNGKVGFLGKKGNKWYENLGYGLGALANLSDGVSLFREVADKILKSTLQKQRELMNMEIQMIGGDIVRLPMKKAIHYYLLAPIVLLENPQVYQKRGKVLSKVQIWVGKHIWVNEVLGL